MAEDRELATGLHELTALVLSTTDLAESLRHIAEITSLLVRGEPMTGVWLERRGRVTTATSSPALADLLDRGRREQGRGPATECPRRAEPCYVKDVSEELSQGPYRARMLADGVHSIYCHPLRSDGEVVGSLNLYSPVRQGFGVRERQVVRLTAAHAGVLLAAAVQAIDQAESAAQLREALACRAVIDQAIGVVVAQRGCDADTAFDLLRAASQNTNRKLVSIATAIMASASGGPPRPGRFRA
ncbi:GAF domain-containing protein [Kutzneria viridogrisea]|uniref:ANTAR domain-containing protein n=2 Tax=Kutzneria TaxID=43356 RepID=W5W7N1_9PSEU|nr:GAF and ANTAR domain-containing protein [Kutzneria albida]AHH96947.1 hypothetical protein KALB_3583 [Kutzneria albida DSM 43870]MBA8932088.1 GAF domain-containing protein [Kutzneria viridogrisea]